MSSPSIKVSVGDLRLGPKEKQYVNEVLDSNRLSHGPFSRKFEDAFAKEHGCKYAVFCNSGTSALQIALGALKEKYGWADGDEVLVPAVTFIATSNIVLYNRMKPVFVDVDPFTYNMDPCEIAEKITRKTRAIIPVHLLGLPADMDRIGEIALGNNLRVIEDSCETMFANHNGRRVGSMGDIGCFSTYIAHYIVTGVGGLATTNDPDLAARLSSLMNHGRDGIYLHIDDDNTGDKEKLLKIVSKRFSFTSLGHSFRCTEMEAAIGLAQLEDKDANVARRKAIAQRYVDGLRSLDHFLQLPYVPPGSDHVFMLFPFVVRAGEKRGLVEFLEVNGIETRDLLPLLSQPIYHKVFGNLEAEYPVAAWLNKGGFYIGCHQHITDEAVDYVIAKFHQYFEGKRIAP